jgi:hypothetical protein
MTDDHQAIKDHLEDPKHTISVVQGSKKYSKQSTHNRFNWTKSDIEKEHQNLDNFLKSIKNQGFTTGATLLLKKPNGSSDKVFSEIDLVIEVANTNTQTPQTSHLPMENHSPAYNPPPPAVQQGYGMGFSSVQNTTLVEMEVKAARYGDLQDKHRQCEKDRDEARLEARSSKLKVEDLERKLALINDKHEFALLKTVEEKKTFLDSKTIQDNLPAILENLPALAGMLTGKPNAQAIQPALAGPNLTDMQNLFVEQVATFPEDILDPLLNVANTMMVDPNYLTHIKSITPQ